jgi:mRNA-degrading endonuclease RelE of RelBE toxin-antitoxin system
MLIRASLSGGGRWYADRGGESCDLASTMYEIEITPEAIDDLRALLKRERRVVVDGIERALLHEPGRETRNRKRLRPNELAEWELRVAQFRVFFDVDEGARVVKVIAMGRKRGNRLYIQDEEYHL